jgi:hypothetical protein
MTDTTTSPSGTVDNAPLSFDQGVDAIAGLLNDDPETDLVKTEVANGNEPAPVSEPTEPTEEDLLLENVELEDVAEPDVEAPSVVNDETEVELDDGTKISIAQLKRNNLFQRDYTRKTEELKAEKQRVDSDFQQRVSEAERELSQKRDLILELANQFLPQEPDLSLMQTDPLAYMEQRAIYEQNMRKLNTLDQQRQQQTAAQRQRQQEQAKQYLKDQRAELLRVRPELKDTKRRDEMYAEIMDIGVNHYGITPEEVPKIDDHRYMNILLDALAYQKLKRKAGAVQKTVAAKPKLVQQQRMAPQAVQVRDRQGRFEALRSTGSIDAAAKSIEDLLND